MGEIRVIEALTHWRLQERAKPHRQWRTLGIFDTQEQAERAMRELNPPSTPAAP